MHNWHWQFFHQNQVSHKQTNRMVKEHQAHNGFSKQESHGGKSHQDGC